jgi:hypothetical protein
MGFPFEQRDAAPDSNGKIDSRFHSVVDLEPRPSRVANAPIPKLPSDSSSVKKSLP